MQPPTAQIGSLEIFWPLIEPVLNALRPRRICEIGVATGALTEKLLAWGDRCECAYVGIDPAPATEVLERFDGSSAASGRELLLRTSHEALIGLEPCDVYFIDGDHNYFTVQGELRWIADAARAAGPQRCGPVIFMHDVGWPWARRDMYYLPTTVPAEERHRWSETLGVALDGEELIEGGLREPGRYAIAQRSGGPRNGVMTAVEDFLCSEVGTAWKSTVLPIAYGLAVLHRPGDATLPVPCRERLEDLRKMAATGGAFLQGCEENFLWLNLYGEYHRRAAVTESSAYRATLDAYSGLQRSYDALLAHGDALENTYKKMLAHSDALEDEYQKLVTAYERLQERGNATANSPQPARPENQFE